MCLCNFGALLSQCISMFIPCDLTVPWYPLQCNLWFALSCRIRSCQSLDSVDPAVSIAAFESEKITALSNLSWCKFSRRSVSTYGFNFSIKGSRMLSQWYVAGEKFTVDASTSVYTGCFTTLGHNCRR